MIEPVRRITAMAVTATEIFDQLASAVIDLRFRESLKKFAVLGHSEKSSWP